MWRALQPSRFAKRISAPNFTKSFTSSRLPSMQLWCNAVWPSWSKKLIFTDPSQRCNILLISRGSPSLTAFWKISCEEDVWRSLWLIIILDFNNNIENHTDKSAANNCQRTYSSLIRDNQNQQRRPPTDHCLAAASVVNPRLPFAFSPRETISANHHALVEQRPLVHCERTRRKEQSVGIGSPSCWSPCEMPSRMREPENGVGCGTGRAWSRPIFTRLPNPNCRTLWPLPCRLCVYVEDGSIISNINQTRPVWESTAVSPTGVYKCQAHFKILRWIPRSIFFFVGPKP